MTTDALSGYGTTFEVEDAPNSGNYIKLAKVRKVSAPSGTVDEIDASHMESPNRTKEFIAGMIDLGEVPLELLWIPGSATDLFILAWQGSGLNRSCRITYPNDVTDTFDGFVKTYSGEVPLNDVMSASLNVRVAGANARV